MNQVERAAFASALPHKANHGFLVFTIAALEIVWPAAWFARGEKFSGNSRSRRSSYGRSRAPEREFTFQVPQDLLRSAGALV
jgi:hypothetical protein